MLFSVLQPLISMWMEKCYIFKGERLENGLAYIFQALGNILSKKYRISMTKQKWQSPMVRAEGIDPTWSQFCSSVQFSSVQSLSRVRLFVTPWIAAHQASLSITISPSSLRLKSIKSMMPSSDLILSRPLLLLPPIPPSIRVFPMSQLFAWGGQSTGVSALASFLPKKSQGWSSEWTGRMHTYIPFLLWFFFFLLLFGLLQKSQSSKNWPFFIVVVI